ncbi:MAG: TRL-like family protein [Desulfobacterales bacterium]|nr:TRL-like family protein [Desulfobacterales bacterium]
MFKNSKSCLLAILIAAFVLTGCAMVMTPATGFLYSDVDGPHHATSNTGYSKVGTSEAVSILGWVATGDASIEAAMKDGGITKIHHVDYHCDSILGIYAKLTVFVYGE